MSEELEVTESQPDLWPIREEQTAAAAGCRETWSSCVPHFSQFCASHSSKWGPAASWFWGAALRAGASRAREGCWPGVFRENRKGCAGRHEPVGVTVSLLIWPQDDDSVPPGMESLISAPLVKTSGKEEEQVGL